MPSVNSGSLTTTSSVTLTKDASDTVAFIQISGTYGTVTFVVEGSLNGTDFGALQAVALVSGQTVTSTISPADNATTMWKVPCEGLTKVRARVTAIASGTVTLELHSAAYVGQPVFQVNQTGQTIAGAITSSSPSAGVGYSTGAGGAVTQATSRTTGVTVNTLCGAITTDTSSLAAGAEAEFTVTNSAVAATDVVVVCLKTESATGTSIPYVSTVANGSFKITLSNLHASTADTSASVINFAVIKSVTS